MMLWGSYVVAEEHRQDLLREACEERRSRMARAGAEAERGGLLRRLRAGLGRGRRSEG